MLKPDKAKTFNEFSSKIFMPYIDAKLERANRVDVVWDCYQGNSLKSQTRQKRGKGTRTRVDPIKIPTNWKSFLRVDDNKTELFYFLAKNLMEMSTSKQLISTCGTNVLSTQPQETALIAHCSHEEADTRMILHAADAANSLHWL